MSFLVFRKKVCAVSERLPALSVLSPAPALPPLPKQRLSTQVLRGLSKFRHSQLNRFTIKPCHCDTVYDFIDAYINKTPLEKKQIIRNLNLAMFGHEDGPYSKNGILEQPRSIAKTEDASLTLFFEQFTAFDASTRRAVGLMLHVLHALESLVSSSTSFGVVGWVKKYSDLLTVQRSILPPNDAEGKQVLSEHTSIANSLFAKLGKSLMIDLDAFEAMGCLTKNEYSTLRFIENFVLKLPSEFKPYCVLLLGKVLPQVCEDRVKRYMADTLAFLPHYLASQQACEYIEGALSFESWPKTNQIQIFDEAYDDDIFPSVFNIVAGLFILKRGELPDALFDKSHFFELIYVLLTEELEQSQDVEFRQALLTYMLDPTRHQDVKAYEQTLLLSFARLANTYGKEKLKQVLKLNDNPLVWKTGINVLIHVEDFEQPDILDILSADVTERSSCFSQLSEICLKSVCLAVAFSQDHVHLIWSMISQIDSSDHFLELYTSVEAATYDCPNDKGAYLGDLQALQSHLFLLLETRQKVVAISQNVGFLEKTHYGRDASQQWQHVIQDVETLFLTMASEPVTESIDMSEKVGALLRNKGLFTSLVLSSISDDFLNALKIRWRMISPEHREEVQSCLSLLNICFSFVD